MNLNLPPKPSLVQLKKQAKDILRAHKNQDPACLPIVRRLRQFARQDDGDVFAGPLALNDVQLALAIYYGYDGWTNLKRRISNLEDEARTPELTKDSGAACIHGLETMDWGGSFYRRQDSYMAVLSAVLRCAGRARSFEEVMGISGGAFDLTVADGLCPSAGRVSGETIARAHQAFGLSQERIELQEGKNMAGVERLRQAVVESIDRGLPVIYMDGENSLIVGYKDGGQTYLCVSYDGGGGYQEMDFPRGMLGPAWFADVLLPTADPVDRLTAVRESLVAAIQIARTEREDGGFNAYDKWIRILAEAPDGTNLHGNAYGYAILLTNRSAAAEYLETVATEFDREASGALSKAAGRYRAITSRLLHGRDCTAHPWEESWTPENRALQGQTMRDNLSDERIAIAEIESALAMMG